MLNCHSFELTDGGEGGGASTPACKRLFVGAQGLPALKQFCLGGMASKPIKATLSQSLRQSIHCSMADVLQQHDMHMHVHSPVLQQS